MVTVHQREAGWKLQVPEGQLGLVVLPGARTVWWTGRVAIGLRYEGRRPGELIRGNERQPSEPGPR